MKKLLLGIIGLCFTLCYSPVSAEKAEGNSEKDIAAHQQSTQAKAPKAAQKQQYLQKKSTEEQDTSVILNESGNDSAFGNFKLKGNDY